MRPSHLAIFLFVGLAALAPSAEALVPIYATGKLGSTDTGIAPATGFDRVLDGDDNSWSVGLGFKLGKRLAIQAEYHDLGSVPGFGSPCPPGAEVCVAVVVPLEADSTALSVSLLPHLSLTRNVRIYGKLGFVSWSSDVSEIGDAARRFIEELDDNELIYGAGLRVLIPGPFDFFAEYERIADVFDTAAIGVTWGF